MKTIKWILTGAVLLTIFAMGCTPGDPEQTALTITQPEGSDALQRYVAMGNSLTAGYMDSGLIMNGQMSSYPFQIAMQLGYSFDSSTDDWFAQPLLAWPGVGTTSLSDEDYAAGMLHFNGAGVSVVDSTLLTQVPALALASAYLSPYNNLGVPGATTLDVTEALDSSTSQSPGNSYFDLILRNPTFGNVNMLNQGISRAPTLVSLWIGNNDVLGGATGGDPVIGENVTPPAAFAAMFEGIVAGLLDGVQARFGYTPHIVAGNIPSITSIPFFIPKAMFDGIVGGAYPTVEVDVAYVVFPALGAVQGGFTDPLPTNWTLTTAEVAAVEGAVDGYNSAIDALATEYSFTVADMHTELGSIAPPENTHFLFLLQSMTPAEAAATTLFSLDGVHPNNRGYTRAANVFIGAINTELGLTGADAVPEAADDETWDPTYPSPMPPPGLAALTR